MGTAGSLQQYASPYVGMGNDPVNLIDPSGGSTVSKIVGVAGDFSYAYGTASSFAMPIFKTASGGAKAASLTSGVAFKILVISITKEMIALSKIEGDRQVGDNYINVIRWNSNVEEENPIPSKYITPFQLGVE